MESAGRVGSVWYAWSVLVVADEVVGVEDGIDVIDAIGAFVGIREVRVSCGEDSWVNRFIIRKNDSVCN